MRETITYQLLCLCEIFTWFLSLVSTHCHVTQWQISPAQRSIGLIWVTYNSTTLGNNLQKQKLTLMVCCSFWCLKRSLQSDPRSPLPFGEPLVFLQICCSTTFSTSIKIIPPLEFLKHNFHRGIEGDRKTEKEICAVTMSLSDRQKAYLNGSIQNLRMQVSYAYNQWKTEIIEVGRQ